MDENQEPGRYSDNVPEMGLNRSTRTRTAEVATITRDLFGGAITALYPVNFVDMSTDCPVEDNQEVYMDRHGYKSVIVEILERIDSVSDRAAMDDHVHDLLMDYNVDGITTRSLPMSERTITFEYEGIDFAFPCILQTFVIIPYQRFKGELIEYGQASVVALCLIRLNAHGTDILIHANHPRLHGTYHPSVDIVDNVFAWQVGEVQAMMELALREFCIRDWDLFNEDVAMKDMVDFQSE